VRDRQTADVVSGPAAEDEDPVSNCRIEPPLIVIWLCPALLSTPTSQAVSGGQEGTGVPSPSMTCPFRSSVMLSAPITIPLSGQFTRSPASFVFAVITSPHAGLRHAAGV
jgi:hypothetical protein